MRVAYICPDTGRKFFENDEPFLTGDVVDCPECGDEHEINPGFASTLPNRWAVLFHAQKYGFRFYRSDRNAIEFVATRATPRSLWFDDGQDVLAYTIGEAIFWPSPAATRSRTVFRHEMCHVRQWRRDGALFWFKYAFEDWRRGYEGNKYERNAERAERPRRTKPGPGGRR